MGGLVGDGSRCACIIACYNEAPRVGAVLQAVTSVRSLGRVVCVDDDSTDGTSDRIARAFPQVQIVRLAANRGKTEAVLEGLKHTDEEYVFLIDADLRNLRANELERAVGAIEADPSLDMIILKLVYDYYPSRWTRGNVLCSGQRILRRTDLLDAIESRPSGFQLELAINAYMMSNCKQVRWMRSSATNTHKIEKMGIVKGISSELHMYLDDLIPFAGAANYWRQVRSFCRRAIDD